MSALDPREQLDRIAEYADSSVRILDRRGSLVGVPGAYELKRWVYERYGNRGNAVYTFIGSLLAIGSAASAHGSSRSRCSSPASAQPRFCSSRRRWPRSARRATRSSFSAQLPA